MTCYRPIQLKRPRTLRDGSVMDAVPMPVPCGRCDGCLLERSRQWAVRCMCEHYYHDSSYFVTLTYNDESLVWGHQVPTLYKPHLQKFLKRLRKALNYRIRYFACGEYGSTTARPHYHLIIFGLTLDDLAFYRVSPSGHNIYLSPFLQSVWGLGDVFIGDVSFESCAYIARYTLKKHYGADRSYYDELGILPEFSTQSLKPGIGANFFHQYFSDMFPRDSFNFEGIDLKPPRYFLKLLQATNPEMYDSIMAARKLLADDQFSENSTERLSVRGRVKAAAIKRLSRD